mgnify:FL=1
MIDRIQLPLGRLGRRGAVLIILGTLWILVGANVLAADYDPSLALSASPAFQSALWIGTGFVACAFAWRPQGQDAPGFLALSIMVGYRCISYAFEWADGRGSAVVDLLFWIIIAALILIIAGWREAGDDHPAGLGVPS